MKIDSAKVSFESILLVLRKEYALICTLIPCFLILLVQGDYVLFSEHAVEWKEQQEAQLHNDTFRRSCRRKNDRVYNKSFLQITLN